MVRNNFGYYLLVCFLVFAAGCGNPNRFTIEGTFRKTDPTPVQLLLLTRDGTQQVDTTTTHNNSFSLTGSAEYTNIYIVKFFNDQMIYLVIRPGDKIKLDIDNSLQEISYYVSGSPESKHVKDIFDQQNIVLKQIDQLSRKWEMNRADSAVRRTTDSAYFSLMKNHQEFTRKFIHEHPQSMANIMALYQNFGRKKQALFDRYEDVDIFNFVDSNLTIAYPNSYPVLALNEDLIEIKQQIAEKTYIQKKVEVGSPLPSLKAPTLSGDTIIIDNTIKNNTLVLFWASWNPFSVKEILELNTFLQSYPNLTKSLKVVTISLDTDREKLGDFLSEHTLNLPVICDYQYWDSEYVGRFDVKHIPSVILADKYGKVVARDIFGPELQNRLNELKP